jgi:hypothetical protein
MISNEEREKIARLPVWVRAIIERLEHANGPMLNEYVRLRHDNAKMQERARRLTDANDALIELIKCAGSVAGAKHIHDWAATVIGTLEGYEIFKSETVSES